MPGIEIAIGNQSDDTVTDELIETSAKVVACMEGFGRDCPPSRDKNIS